MHPSTSSTEPKVAVSANVQKSQPLLIENTEAQKPAVDNTNYEEILAWSTVALALFTALLFFVTAKLWRATLALGKEAKVTSDRQAREMQESLTVAQSNAKTMEASVELARREFLATHRPKIILRDATSVQDMGELIIVKYTLVNVGDTEAKILAGALDLRVYTGMDFEPDNLPTVDEDESDIKTITLKCGEQVNLLYTSPTLKWMTDNYTCDEFADPAAGMHFYGQIVYQDALGTRRHVGFRRKFSHNQKRFLPVKSGTHYEYQD